MSLVPGVVEEYDILELALPAMTFVQFLSCGILERSTTKITRARHNGSIRVFNTSSLVISEPSFVLCNSVTKFASQLRALEMLLRDMTLEKHLKLKNPVATWYRAGVVSKLASYATVSKVVVAAPGVLSVEDL